MTRPRFIPGDTSRGQDIRRAGVVAPTVPGLAPRMDLVLEKASVLCYRLYDVADEIDLGVAESVLARDARRLRFSRSGAEFLLLPNPPLDHRPRATAAGPPRRAGGGRGARAAVRLRVDLHRPHRAGVRGNGAGRADPARGPALRRTGGGRAGARAGRDPAQGSRSRHGEPAPLGAGGALRGHLRRGDPERPLRGGGARTRGPGAAAPRGDRGAGALASPSGRTSPSATSATARTTWWSSTGTRPSSTSRRGHGTSRTSWRSRTPSCSSSATTTTRSTTAWPG